jgi:outer membrane beta-barrel protein
MLPKPVMRALFTAALWVVLPASLVLVAAPASAQTEERRDLRGDELRERIPAVTGHLFLKRNRHEMAPLANVSVADAFRRKYIGGLAYTFHYDDHLGFTLRGGYSLAMTQSGSAQICTSPGVCRPPTDEELDTLPGNLNLVASVSGEFSPIYGKINLIAERVLHFDLYATAGLGAATYTFFRGGEDLSGFSPTLLLGVGQRFFVNQWIAVRLEILDVIYAQPTGKTANRARDSAIQNQFLFTAGVSFFFPTTFTYERL